MAEAHPLEQMKIMNQHIKKGFDVVNKTPVIGALDRHRLLEEAALADITDQATRRLLRGALRDAGTIAFSAYDKVFSQPYADRLNESPTAITARSLSLLAVAALPPSSEQGFFYLYHDWTMDKRAPFIKIHPQYLDIVVKDAGLEVIYGPEPLVDLTTSLLNNPGCPAQGAILNSFYKRYATTILSDRS